MKDWNQSLGVDESGNCQKHGDQSILSTSTPEGPLQIFSCPDCPSQTDSDAVPSLNQLREWLLKAPTANGTSENGMHSRSSENEQILEKIQSMLVRQAQVQQIRQAEKEAEIETLREQLQLLEKEKQESQSLIATLQAKVEKQEKTIANELKMIKSIAKKRADSRRSSQQSNPNSNANRSSKLVQQSPGSMQSAVETDDTFQEFEPPPKLPYRKVTQGMTRPSEFSDLTSSGLTHAPSLGTEISESSPGRVAKPVDFVTSDFDETYGSSEDPAPRPPVRQMSEAHVSSSSQSNSFKVRSKASEESSNGSTSRKQRPKRVNRGKTSNEPPAPPQRQASQDALTRASQLSATKSDQSGFSLASSEEDTLSQEIRQGLTDKSPENRRKFYQHRMGVPSTSSDLFTSSELTLDTHSDEVIYKTDKPQRQDSGRNVPYAIVEEDEPDSRRSSARKSNQQHNQDIQFGPLPESESSAVQGVQRNLSAESIGVPGLNQTPESSNQSKEISFRPQDSGSTQQSEIRFDASATFDNIDTQQASRRTSIADIKFDGSNRLLLEASKALSQSALVSPSSGPAQPKSTPRNGDKTWTKSLVTSQSEREIALTPKVSSDSNDELVIESKRVATTSKAHSREIALETPIRGNTKTKGGPSLLERHLEKNKLSNLGPSMHNKTEEEILQEKIYGNAAMASNEDEEDDEYDYFADLPVSKGYLEYHKSLNLSPVSALTTGSYLKESAHRHADRDGDEDEEEIGPRKALHNTGFAKRLPLEDGFDSDDDDTNVKQDDDDEEESQDSEQKAYPSQDSGPHGSDEPRSEHPRKVFQDSTRKVCQSPPDPQKSSHSKHMKKFLSPASANSKSDRQSSLKVTKRVIQVNNEIVKDKYGDGGIYSGSIAADTRLPHGQGNMKYENERQYNGDWKGGRWHGFGKWMNPNGDCYEGTFVYDARHGSGTYTWKNGNVYVGDFHEDKRQGTGVFNFANGNVFEGDFVNGVFEGRGQYKFEGGFYDGEWKSGRYDGSGLLLFTDGSSYEGYFRDGVAHGKGKETSADGKVRHGEWQNGRPMAN